MALFPLHLIPNNTRIDFMRWRMLTVSFMAVLMLASVGLIATKGFNYALDFTGGTSVELLFEKPADVDALRDRLAEAAEPGAQEQPEGTATDGRTRLQPEDAGADAEAVNRTADEVLAAASPEDNPATIKGRSYVGPQVGQDLAGNGIYAIVFVVLGF